MKSLRRYGFLLLFAVLLIPLVLQFVFFPSKHQDLTINPLKGLNSVSFGDSRETIEALIGPPQLTTSAGALVYPDLGMVLYMRNRSALSAIEVFTPESNPSVRASFPGTIGGVIRLQCSLSAATKAIGEPRSVAKDDEDVTAEWPQLGLTLHFLDDRLLQAYATDAAAGAAAVQ